MPDFGIKKAYRPRWQETPGYKSVVDQDSQLGLNPHQTENDSVDKGQSNSDATWPVELPQSHEKQRALPLPSNHDKKREKRIGPTTVNKPRKSPERTLSVPGEEYGHPTKFDYNFPTRRNESLAAVEDDFLEEDPVDDQLEPVAIQAPGDRQKNLGGLARMVWQRWWRKNREKKKRKEKMDYRLKDRINPKKKRERGLREDYPNRYERKGIDPRTPAQKSRAYYEKNLKVKKAGMDLLSEVMETLGSTNWNTTTKQTGPPGQLDQNFGPGQSRDTGTPRKDQTKQRGESLRAPDLGEKHQPGLFTQHEPPSAGGINIPTTMNPTDGSGKVMPMEWYTDSVNNTQAIPDGRQDRYLQNNNFEVKQGQERTATTVAEILKRCDKKIKERAKKRTPKLSRIDTKNWIWHWKSGNHTVRVQAFKRGNSKNFRKLNLRVSCSCPYWRWWGPAHWASKSDYQKGKAPGTAAYPKVRDPARWRPVCKHAYGVLEKSQDFFVRPKKSPLRKLGSRYFVDSLSEIEVSTVDSTHVARVARKYLQQQAIQRVAARYREKEKS